MNTLASWKFLIASAMVTVMVIAAFGIVAQLKMNGGF